MEEKKRCVSIEDREPEVEVAAAANEPPVEGADAEDEYGEYFAMIDIVIEAGEAALGDARERKQCLHQCLRLVQVRIRCHPGRDRGRIKRTPVRDKRSPPRDRRTPPRDKRTMPRHRRTPPRDKRTLPRDTWTQPRDKRSPP